MRRALLAGLAAVSIASAERVVQFDGTVRIGRNLWHAVAIGPPETPARVECAFTVVAGSPAVRAFIATRREAERFRDGAGYRAAAETSYLADGVLQYRITRPGDYMVIVENRGTGAEAVTVRLRVEMFFRDTAGVAARQLDPARRRLVVGLSLAFFAVVAGWSGRRLWSATRRAPPA
jgi:hypothetical protein